MKPYGVKKVHCIALIGAGLVSLFASSCVTGTPSGGPPSEAGSDPYSVPGSRSRGPRTPPPAPEIRKVIVKKDEPPTSPNSFAITSPQSRISLGRSFGVSGTIDSLNADEEILLIVHPLSMNRVWVQDPVSRLSSGFRGRVQLGESDEHIGQWYEIIAAKAPEGRFRVLKDGHEPKILREMKLSGNSILIYRSY